MFALRSDSVAPMGVICEWLLMPSSDDLAQHARVQDRFTRTAEQFAKFSLSSRTAEAEKLVQLVLPHLPRTAQARAIDVACGPGTFTLAFAPHVHTMFGLDLTPAILAQARAAARKGSHSNVWLACADASRLPLPAASFDLASCAYSLHHMPEPAAALAEMSRVVRPGGLLALVDLFVPEDPARADLNNRIERARDSSHSRTLSIAELRTRAEAAGFQILASEISERPRHFDEWMAIAGWRRGDTAYVEARRLMEQGIPDAAAGFRAQPSGNDIAWVQSSFLIVARI